METLPRNFSRKDNFLHYKGCAIETLAKKFEGPIRIKDPEVLTENYTFLKEKVGKILEQKNISSEKFLCGYAIKANQEYALVAEAAKSTDFIEVSSANDLKIVEKISSRLGDKMIVCHGFKLPQSEYSRKIIKLAKKNVPLVVVLDSAEELKPFIALRNKLDIGIRISANTNHGAGKIIERFGVTEENVQTLVTEIKKYDHLKLTMLHMHVNGTMKDIQAKVEELSPLFRIYESLNNQHIEIKYVNVGGGLPSRSFTNETTYQKYFENIFDNFKGLSLPIPIILSESGRFLAGETQFLVLKVIAKKSSNEDFDWYILNGSSINLIPEHHLDKNYSPRPIPVIETDNTQQAFCVGTTCDPEDYFYPTPIPLPNFGIQDDMYLVIPETGAYQESLAGLNRNVPGHCLIENATVLYKKGETFLIQKNNWSLKSLGY